MNTKRIVSVLGGMAATVLLAALSAPAFAVPPITPPDLSVCNDVDCSTLHESVCSSGFKITLLGVDPANFSTNGSATYHYQICDAHLADCPEGDFHGLSHLDLTFPMLGEIGGCLASGTSITGSCTAVDNTPSDGHTASVGAFGQGDSSCFAKTCGGVQGAGATPCNNSSDCPAGVTCITGGSNFVAKCTDTDLNAGDCINMDVTIAGELTGLGTGATVVVDKEATTCTASCMAGPSCTPCEEELDGEACLTRTIGFWGTHPGIAAEYDPVTVCGVSVNGQTAGTCSTSEALCSNANDLKSNPPYLQLVAQLTAAKLNLNATAALAPSGVCSTWLYNDDPKTIQEWIAYCEGSFCSGTKSAISGSMCIQALTAFNESVDTGFDVTPPPFESPGPAKPAQCQLSRGNRTYVGLLGGLGCAAP